MVLAILTMRMVFEPKGGPEIPECSLACCKSMGLAQLTGYSAGDLMIEDRPATWLETYSVPVVPEGRNTSCFRDWRNPTNGKPG
jgi:hypothetical protein